MLWSAVESFSMLPVTGVSDLYLKLLLSSLFFLPFALCGFPYGLTYNNIIILIQWSYCGINKTIPCYDITYSSLFNLCKKVEFHTELKSYVLLS